MFLQTISNIVILVTKLKIAKRQIDTHQFQVREMTINGEMIVHIHSSTCFLCSIHLWRFNDGKWAGSSSLGPKCFPRRSRAKRGLKTGQTADRATQGRDLMLGSARRWRCLSLSQVGSQSFRTL